MNIPWTQQEDEQLKTWYAQVNGAFHPYEHMAEMLNDEFHGGKKVRNYRSISRREGHVNFGKPWGRKRHD